MRLHIQLKSIEITLKSQCELFFQLQIGTQGLTAAKTNIFGSKKFVYDPKKLPVISVVESFTVDTEIEYDRRKSRFHSLVVSLSDERGP